VSWRLLSGTVAFAIWAPASLAALPLAALLAAAPDRSARARALAVLLGAGSLALLIWGPGGAAGRLGDARSAYIVLVTAAFLAVVLLWPASLLRQATRATLLGGAATALLVHAFWGAEGWRALAWEATREASRTLRFVERTSDAAAVFEPVVRFVSVTTPGMLALQTLAGLALAWRWHLALAQPPLAGAPLARFREFRLSDGWVWGMVAWLALLAVPTGLSALQVAGANVGFVLSALYTLRGAAIVAAFAEAAGMSIVALAMAGAAAAALALPLLFVIPGLCTLGITDTWYEYRRRIAARSRAAPRPPNTP
jgi:hypothetical protein